MADQPDMTHLLEVARLVAAALKVTPPDDAETEGLLRHLLYDNPRGETPGRQAWACLGQWLITELELRDLLLAHLATFLSRRGGINEPDVNLWITPEIPVEMERALYGRRADRQAVDGDR